MAFTKAIFRYISTPISFLFLKSILIYAIIYSLIITIIGLDDVPRTIGIIQPILLFLFISASRKLAQNILGDNNSFFLKKQLLPEILIYGAGKTGQQLAVSIENGNEMKLIGFLDDDKNLWGNQLNEKNIYNPENVDSLIQKFNIHSVLLAIPSISKDKKNKVLEYFQKLQLPVRTVPNPSDIVKGKLKIYDLLPLDVEDLLGRDPVKPNETLLEKKFQIKKLSFLVAEALLVVS